MKFIDDILKYVKGRGDDLSQNAGNKFERKSLDGMHETLAPILKANANRKRGLTWHKQLADTILVFHADKSRWGADQYSFE
jgi:hypothetical protein